MKTRDLYRHKHWDNLVQITGQEGSWVEFLSKGSLFWLEQLVFEQAYTYYRVGDPIQVDLDQLRQQAQASGILVPREFNLIA